MNEKLLTALIEAAVSARLSAEALRSDLETAGSLLSVREGRRILRDLKATGKALDRLAEDLRGLMAVEVPSAA